MALRGDDLNVGDYVTISRGPVTKMGGGMFGFGESEEHEDQGMNGVVLRVLAISLPYVAVESVTKFQRGRSYWHDNYHEAGTRMSLDFRKVRLTRISQEYADAMMGKKRAEELRRQQAQQTAPLRKDLPSSVEHKDLPGFSEWLFGKSKESEQLEKASPNCPRCGGRDWEHASTCPKNPKGPKK